MLMHKIVLKDGDKTIGVSRVPFNRVPAVYRMDGKAYRPDKYIPGKKKPHENSMTVYQLIQFP